MSKPRTTRRKSPAASVPTMFDVPTVRVRLLRPHRHQGTGYDTHDVIEVHPDVLRWMLQRGIAYPV